MKTVLFILVSFTALTAALAGMMLISNPDGSNLNLPPGLLNETPFKDYLLPGILLAIIVGGINLLAVACMSFGAILLNIRLKRKHITATAV